MEPEIALAVGRALFSKLSAFHEIEGKSVCAIWHVEEQGNLNQVILDFGLVSLIVNATPNDDSIDFHCTKSAEIRQTVRADVSQNELWREVVGSPFGWGWVTVNQQGYCDGLLLSFGGIEPQVLMSVIATSIKLRRISVMSEA